MTEMDESAIARNYKSFLVVPKRHVKRVKSALEQADALDRSAKIAPAETCLTDVDFKTSLGPIQDYMVIPTTLDTIATRIPDTHTVSNDILTSLGLLDLSDEILTYPALPSTNSPPQDRSYLRGAIRSFFSDTPNLFGTPIHSDLTPDLLATSFPESYSIYPPLLLLPHNTFSAPPWKLFLEQHPLESDLWKLFWTKIAATMGVTHIAINSPIPPSTTTKVTSEENILRSPVNITPLYGSFGPLPTPQTLSHPTQQDFDKALWVTTIQNGIHQIWAPSYTMFSRGNIREKTRLLHHPTVARNFDDDGGASVVDMYAGIGYFAFSYKKAGLDKIFCFEINPWSVEGLRRGIEKNGWTYKIYKSPIPSPSTTLDNPPTTTASITNTPMTQDLNQDFHIFQTSNSHAPIILSSLPHHFYPPIRHINLGLLPSSRLSWHSATRLIDVEKGGWVHVHENVGVGDLDDRAREVEVEFQRLVDEFDGERERGDGEREIKRQVRVEHVERVKMYAPGVVHVVFDVAIS